MSTRRRSPVLGALHAVLFAAAAVFGTAVAWAGCMLGLLVTPRTARVSRWCERLWGRFLLFAAGARVRVEGAERLPDARPRLFVANHASFLDPPLLLGTLPARARFVMKRQLAWLPFVGWYSWLGGHLMLDRDDPRAGREVVVRAVERARARGMSPAVFPEGTRSRDGLLAPFRPGSFGIAIDGELEVVPVAILGTHAILPKGALAPRSCGPVLVRIGAPIPSRGLAGGAGRRFLSDRTRAALLALGVPDSPAPAAAPSES